MVNLVKSGKALLAQVEGKATDVAASPQTTELEEVKLKSPQDPLSYRRELRQRRRRLLRNVFFGIAILPTVLALIYYTLIASPIYVSKASVTVRSSESNPAINLLGGLTGATGAGSNSQDLALIEGYMRSQSLVKQLETDVDLRAMYGAEDIDWLMRLPENATIEELREKFTKMVTVINDGTGSLELEVRAFSAVESLHLAETLIAKAEVMVNSVSNKAREDAMQYASLQMERAENKLRETVEAITRFRAENHDIDPRGSAGSVAGVISSLEAAKAEARTELSQLRAYLQEDTAAISRVKTRIKALQKQAEQERRRFSTKNKGQNLSHKLAKYQGLLLDNEIAMKGYVTALTSLESARTKAATKYTYLVPYAKPVMPDEAVEPRVFRSVVQVFLISFLSACILILFLAVLREHSYS